MQQKTKVGLVFMIFVIAVFIVIKLASAELQTLGTFEQGNIINLVQSCSNSTYSNLTRITYPDSSFALSGNYQMTKSSNDYNYSFSNTTFLGQYLVYGFCDENGINTNWVYDFYITPDGTITNGWKVTIQIFLIISALLLSIFFLYLAGNKQDIGRRGVTEKEEVSIIRFFLIGLAFVFMVAHIIMTNALVQNTLGESLIASSYGYITFAFYMVLGLIFLYSMTRITFNEINIIQKRRGLR